MSPPVAARLADLGIERIVEANQYVMLARGSCVAMVHGSSLGSSGYMTESGLAYLVWRAERPWLVSKGSEIEAAPQQVEEIRKFSEDLKLALSLS